MSLQLWDLVEVQRRAQRNATECATRSFIDHLVLQKILERELDEREYDSVSGVCKDLYSQDKHYPDSETLANAAEKWVKESKKK